MLKNLSGLTHKIGDKFYHLMCDLDSPINEIKDSLFEFLKYIGKIEDHVKSQQELKKDFQEPIKEETKVE